LEDKSTIGKDYAGLMSLPLNTTAELVGLHTVLEKNTSTRTWGLHSGVGVLLLR